MDDLLHIMVKYGLEDIIDHFNYEAINLNRTQMWGLIDLYEPDTGEIMSLEPASKTYIAKHLFNKNEYQKYRANKGNDYVFAELVLKSYV
jgi:hypothetical protein